MEIQIPQWLVEIIWPFIVRANQTKMLRWLESIGHEVIY